jgi:hypothetical protein
LKGQALEVSPITRRAGELCLDVIREAAPESEPAITFDHDPRACLITATITATINGKRLSVVDFSGVDEWEGIDWGEWKAATFWYKARDAFGIELPDSNDRTGGLPKCLRPTSGPLLLAGREVPGQSSVRLGFWR